VNAKVINIVSATLTGKYKIRLSFDDGVAQEVDFGTFLGKAQHPDIRAYLDESRFNAFRLEHGELVWGDYDLCFPIMDLYLNQIDKNVDLQAVA
jgi:hypothetical protein